MKILLFKNFIENKEQSDKKEKNKIACFLSNFAPSYEDAKKNIDIEISKKEYNKICKKLNKKTIQ